MKSLVLGLCDSGRVYRSVDPDAAGEAECEALTVRGLSCAYPTYDCIVFGGGFRLDDEIRRPDLALVANDRSHWFIVEVELASHSFEKHVLPQVRTFRYGDPEPECASILARELNIHRGRAETMLNYIPYGVAVVANRRVPAWEAVLQSHSVSLLSVGLFRDENGADIVRSTALWK